MLVKINLHKEEQAAIQRLADSMGYEGELFADKTYERKLCKADMKDLGDVVSIDVDMDEDFAVDTVNMFGAVITEYLGLIKVFAKKFEKYLEKWGE